jgi:hypothetical protein
MRILKVRGFCLLSAVIVLSIGSGACAQQTQEAAARPSLSTGKPAAPLSNEDTQALVRRVLHTELAATQDLSHPMQYRLRKVSPRLSTTKLIVETKEGDVARLVEINDTPLNPQDQANEDARLTALLKDPGQQRHREQREQGDAERARKIVRALPDAFLYSYAGIVQTPAGPSYRLSFQPNPGFDSGDMESQVLKGMAGELWIDVAQQRVTRLEGKRIRDVDYGLGVLGKLDAGGTLLLEQADTGNHQWRTTHMVLVMNARLLFKQVKLDTTLEMTEFKPVSAGMGYQQAIQTLLAKPEPKDALPISGQR